MSEVKRGAASDIWCWVVSSALVGALLIYFGATPGLLESFEVEHRLPPTLLRVGALIGAVPFLFQACALGYAARLIGGDEQSADRARVIGILAVAVGNVAVLAMGVIGVIDNFEHLCAGGTAVLLQWVYSVRVFSHLEALSNR